MRASVTGKPKLRQRGPRTPLQWGDTLRELADMHGVGVVAQDEKGNLNTPVRFNREDWTWEGFDGKEWIPTVEGSGTTEIITRIISTVVTGDTISHNATLAKQGGLSPNQYYHLNRAHHDQVGAFLDDAGFPGGVTVGQFSNTGLHIFDTDASHDLIIKAGDGLSADRILTLTTGDAARTITLSGNPTLADWFDQAVKAASSPTFAGMTLTAFSGFVLATAGVLSARALLDADIPSGIMRDTEHASDAHTMTLDGVDLSAFKTTYNAHDHGAADPTQVDYTTLLNIPTSFTPTAHNILSASHGDSTAASAVRGDIIIGQGASPVWARLPFPPSPTGKFLQATATDAGWSAYALTIEAGSILGQDYSTDASPTFAGLTLSGLAAGYLVFTGAGGVLSIDGGVTYNAATDTLTVINLQAPTGAIGAVATPVPTAYITSLYTNASSVIAGATLGTTTITGSENSAYILSLIDATAGGNYAQGLKLNLRYTAGSSRDIVDFQSGSVSKFKVTGSGTTITAGNESVASGGTLADGYAGAVRLTPTYTGVAGAPAETVTRGNYIDVLRPTLTDISMTDACVLRFPAAAGTHEAVDAGSTKTTPGTVNAWVKVNVNGTVYYIPAYTSKTT